MPDGVHKHAVTVEIARRQSIDITVNRACSNCGAPPVYKSHWSIRDGWPGAYVPPGDPRDNQSVGPNCACCGTPFAPPEELGEVFVREFHAAPRGLTAKEYAALEMADCKSWGDCWRMLRRHRFCAVTAVLLLPMLRIAAWQMRGQMP